MALSDGIGANVPDEVKKAYAGFNSGSSKLLMDTLLGPVLVDRYQSQKAEDAPIGFGGFAPAAAEDIADAGIDINGVYAKMARQRDDYDRAQAFLEEQKKHQFIGWQTSAQMSDDIRVNEDAGTITYTDLDGNVWHLAMTADGGLCVVTCEVVAARVAMPAEVAGRPVVEIAADAFANSEALEDLVVPDSVTKIGLRAFLSCKNLRSLVLPKEVDEFTAQWLRGCVSLEELTLPGNYRKLENQVFDTPALKRLLIGPGMSEIDPGAFGKATLDVVAVDPENPYLSTDGLAIYSKDGSCLVAMAVRRQGYVVLPGCKTIGKKAFYAMDMLEDIVLPVDMEVLGDFAFGRTSLSGMATPAGLHAIGEKCFFHCETLAEVTLNEGLESIGEDAFSYSGISALEIPSTLTEIGRSVALGTKLVYEGPDRTLTMRPGSPTIQLDDHGGLYRKEDDGLHFVGLLNPLAQAYAVGQGTLCIDERSFTGHSKIASVVLPEGVEVIASGAFRNCRALREVSLSSTLKRIEAEAFLDTVLESVCIPAACERIGASALVTKNAHTGNARPSLRSVQVQEGNPRYFTTNGMLCERFASGRCQVLIYDGSCPHVVIPPETFSIAAYAFSGACDIRTISYSTAIDNIEICGMKILNRMDNIHIDCAKPIQGHDSFDVSFPDTLRGIHEQQNAFSAINGVDLKKLFGAYDNCIANSEEHYNMDPKVIMGLYDQSKRMIARLKDPVFMTPHMKSMLDNVFAKDIEPICEAVARCDDRAAIDDLLELGYLNAENLIGIIDRVGRLQDAAMTGYLLEKKRQFSAPVDLDFDL